MQLARAPRRYRCAARSTTRDFKHHLLDRAHELPGAGPNFRNTIQLLARLSETIVFCAVLHHTDCLSAQSGLRGDLAVAAQQMTAALSGANVHAPVLTGQIRTETNELRWSDEPVWRYEPFTFGAGDPISRRG